LSKMTSAVNLWLTALSFDYIITILIDTLGAYKWQQKQKPQ
jgi:hypothetical protein